MCKCEWCSREFKAKAGVGRHMLFCKDKPKPVEVIELEVVGEGNYYKGHPRRLTKLKGLLSRTFDADERHRILLFIDETQNENI